LILFLILFVLLEMADAVFGLNNFVTIAVIVTVLLLYFALMERSPWQATLGERATGIKVVNSHACRVGLWRACVRVVPPWGIFFASVLLVPSDGNGYEIAPIVFLGVLLINCMMSGWTARKQTLLDKLAGTFVVFRAVQSGQPWPVEPPPLRGGMAVS
jgi:uncharacterized RDD family membrane protein YckC